MTTQREYPFGDCIVTESDYDTGLTEICFRDAARRLYAIVESTPLQIGWFTFAGELEIVFETRRQAFDWAYAHAQNAIRPTPEDFGPYEVFTPGRSPELGYPRSPSSDDSGLPRVGYCLYRDTLISPVSSPQQQGA